MYRKIVWCYVLVLTLLDISLNTKLTAQGKSHDVTVHDSLIEGISFQEWGKESEVSAGGAGQALRLAPATLRFGRAALGAAHALTVTLTNTHNATVHLASVAGTTPDFHASFFESKTLPPNGNTSFSVVYLGRREGPVAAHLYIHTSLGVHKYPVSAEGVASEWGVWPLVGLRVPHNATLEPLLTIYNPTDKHIQVSEVYSSGAWVGLRLPGGGGAAPRAAWRVPPRAERALVRLRLRLPPPPPSPHHRLHDAQHQRPLTAYIRIKGTNVGGAGGGGLVVGVEATPAPAGAFLLPPHLRLRLRGSNDPPHTWSISAGNSAAGAVRVEAALCGRCGAPGLADPALLPLDHAANGVKNEGAHLTVTRAQLEPHQEPEEAMQLTLDYARLWARHAELPEASAGDGLWCGGWVRAGASALPYSVRLLPGTLALLPSEIEVVTANKEEAVRERELRVRNEFPVPLRISAIDYGPDVHKYFHTEELTPLVVPGDGSALVLKLRLRAAVAATDAATDAAAHAQLSSHVALRTNVSDYTVPLLLHSGTLELEWEWPNSEDGHLRVGGVGASSTRRVGLRVRNRAPAALCVTDHAVRLPHAQLTLDTQSCIPAGTWRQAWLTLVAPARAGALTGSVYVSTPHATARAYVTLHVHAGRLHAHPLALTHPAPYAWGTAPLELESSMALSMRVLNVTQPSPDPAVTFVPSGSGWISGGRQTVGEVQYAPEKVCAPNCYTGLDLDSPEGMSWLRRGSEGAGGEGAEGAEGGEGGAEGLRADVSLLRARRLLYARVADRVTNITIYVHTNEVVGIPVTGSVRAHWPRLRVSATAGAGATATAGALAGVGGAAHVKLRVRNPARVPLVLHPVVTSHAPHAASDILQIDEAEGIETFCKTDTCTWSPDAFSVTSWRAVRGDVTPFTGNWSQAFLLAPAAELELTVTFAPPAAAALAAYLYLRNNLTIVEIVPLWGRGAYPSFELGGRRPGSGTPLLFEVSECPAGGEGGEGGGGEEGAEGGVVRRTVSVRNTGAVSVRLRDWRVGVRACQARGFRLQPCAPLLLAPNETRTLRLAFAPDYTLARAAAPLRVRTDLGTVEFMLSAAAPARLLRACQARAPRPPWEPALRTAGTLLVLTALALVLAAAVLDAERELRRARAARAAAPPPQRAPLDLRAAAVAPPPPPPRPAPPPRRRRAPRRPPPADPHAERQAFERWRAEVLRRADIDNDHSSEEADAEAESTPPSEPLKTSSRSESPAADARRSSESDAPSLESSVGSDSSRPDSDRDQPPPAPPEKCVHLASLDVRPDDTARGSRARREASEPPRRSERRTEEPGRARLPMARAHARRAAGRRRGGERAPGTPPRASPPRPEPRAPPALRWGATWSSVVAAGAAPPTSSSNGSPAPLPPIGSDVRRRTEERAGSGPGGGGGGGGVCAGGGADSLFFFNGEQPPPAPPAADAAYWRVPPPDRAAYPPHHDYLTEFEDTSTLGGGFGSVWAGAGGAWSWGGAVVRPPPGFNSPPPPPPRAYDPFRSLAAIWAPGALDWRQEPPAAPPSAPPPAPPPAPPHAPPPAPLHAPPADERAHDE